MNSIILEEKSYEIGNEITLSQVNSTHLISTLKVKVGDILKATFLNDGLGTLRITNIDMSLNLVKAKIESRKEGLSYKIRLLVGASRPQTMKKVLEHASTMGVSEFIIVGTTLTEKSYLSSKIYMEDEFSELAKLGLSQSAIFYKLPKISIFPNIKKIPLEVFQDSKKFILSPYTQNNFINIEISNNDLITLAIGPERGWTSEELKYFVENDFKECCLSQSILRVENATIATLGIINAKFLS